MGGNRLPPLWWLRVKPPDSTTTQSYPNEKELEVLEKKEKEFKDQIQVRV